MSGILLSQRREGIDGRSGRRDGEVRFRICFNDPVVRVVAFRFDDGRHRSRSLPCIASLGVHGVAGEWGIDFVLPPGNRGRRVAVIASRIGRVRSLRKRSGGRRTGHRVGHDRGRLCRETLVAVHVVGQLSVRRLLGSKVSPKSALSRRR
jgi:hypothetical protein